VKGLSNIQALIQTYPHSWPSTIFLPPPLPHTTMSAEIIDLTIEPFLPEYIKHHWIPLDGQPVSHLFQFTRYPPQNMVYQEYHDFSQLLHEEGVTNFDPNTLLQLGPPSSELSDKYKAAIKATSSLILSFTLVSITGNAVKLPIWVLDYWREIDRPVGYWRSWKKILVWLRDISQSDSMVGICEQVMAGLSCFPWNGSNCAVHDMELLLTTSSLSDFHLHSTLTTIFQYHDEAGNRLSDHHTFLPYNDLISIITAYEKFHTGLTGMKGSQLLEVENKIISGQIQSVAGVVYLPNHWTSIIFSFKPPRILYGDSLGSPLSDEKAVSFRQWMCHMLSRAGTQMPVDDISIYHLSTGVQRDSISCGLFALNSISCYYFPERFPTLQHGDLSLPQYRLELALDLLQKGSINHILYRTMFLH